MAHVKIPPLFFSASLLRILFPFASSSITSFSLFSQHSSLPPVALPFPCSRLLSSPFSLLYFFPYSTLTHFRCVNFITLHVNVHSRDCSASFQGDRHWWSV
jgi:hypothetical protein